MKEQAFLFVDENKISSNSRKQLGRAIKIYPYEQFSEFLTNLANEDLYLWIDPATTSQWIINCLNNKDKMVLKKNPITAMKAIKNPTELEGFRKCHLRDGVAMAKFLYWLSKEVPSGNVTEISASDRLYELRKQQD